MTDIMKLSTPRVYILNLLGVRGWPVITFYLWWWGVWSEGLSLVARPAPTADYWTTLVTVNLWTDHWYSDHATGIWCRCAHFIKNDFAQYLLHYFPRSVWLLSKAPRRELSLLYLSRFLSTHDPWPSTEPPPEAAGRWDLLKSIRSRQSVTVAGDNPVQKHEKHKWSKKNFKVGSAYKLV